MKTLYILCMVLSKSFWAKYFKTYDVLNKVIPYNELIEVLCTKLEIKKGDRVLDAGCGTSNLSVRLEKLGADVFGTDYSLEGLRIGRSKSPGIKLLQNDLNINLPFKDCSFDKVVSCNTLYLLPSENLTSVFKEFYRVLKPGGRVVITNLTGDFKPYKIYFNHIRKFSIKYGQLKTIISIISLIIPTVKMFYYGSYIQKNSNQGFNFFETDDQQKLLILAGFNNISPPTKVFASLGILNTAEKL